MSIDSREDLSLERAESWLARLETAEVQCCAGLLQLSPETALRHKRLMRSEQGRLKNKEDCLQAFRPVEISARIPAPESFPASLVQADGAVFLWELPADQNPTCSGTGCGSWDRFASSWPRTRF